MDAFLKRVLERRELEQALEMELTPAQAITLHCKVCGVAMPGTVPFCTKHGGHRKARKLGVYEELVMQRRERLQEISQTLEETQMSERFCDKCDKKLRRDNTTTTCSACKKGSPRTGRTAEEVTDSRRALIEKTAEERREDAAAMAAKRELARAERREKTVAEARNQVLGLSDFLDAVAPTPEQRAKLEHAKKLQRFRTLADALGLDPDEILSDWIEGWMRPLREAVTRPQLETVRVMFSHSGPPDVSSYGVLKPPPLELSAPVRSDGGGMAELRTPSSASSPPTAPWPRSESAEADDA